MTAVALWHGLTNSLPKREGKIDEPSRDPPIAAEAVLKDAELFLHHAASTGLPIDPTVRDAIITARMEITNGTLGKEHLGDLYTAYSSLAIAAKPVTVETIRACRDLALGALKRYRRYVFFLTVIVIVLSMASFMASAITEKIGDDITAANKLAVQLTAELGPLPEPRNLNTQLLAYEPSKVAEAVPDEATSAKDFSTWRAQVPSGLNITEVISELQQFTALMREIHDRARSAHSVAGVSDPFVTLRANHRDDFWRLFQLPAASTNLRQTTSDKIYLFQRIRVFGNEVDFNISKFNGAIGAYLLPILYAVLGAFAYGLRKFSAEIMSMTYHPSQASVARIITAMICGTIVGLFSNFWQGISLQPLAIAFLVGYGVEVFFAFLDKLLQSLGASGANLSTPNPSAAAR